MAPWFGEGFGYSRILSTSTGLDLECNECGSQTPGPSWRVDLSERSIQSGGEHDIPPGIDIP